MKILFASPERDLLESFKILLEADLGETVTAFDGTQVLSLLDNEQFDAAVIDREIPRVGYRILTERAKEKKVPVIALINQPVSVKLLTEEPLPNGFLSFPFDAEGMKKAIRDTVDKAANGGEFDFAGTIIDAAGFRMAGGQSLTGWETDVLRALKEGKTVTTDDGAAISALNIKFEKAGSKVRIRYIAGKGFETVTENE